MASGNFSPPKAKMRRRGFCKICSICGGFHLRNSEGTIWRHVICRSGLLGGNRFLSRRVVLLFVVRGVQMRVAPVDIPRNSSMMDGSNVRLVPK